ncbi:cutinase transcription factor 1 beta [Fusarium heterosporum]|uniref:Cutinase transcription factor 1 beta n=1 Tax=Fusarium heterosporum TaxID=42747 RepID=A0A8H5TU56_FUSHE|nr:cutinase transcription factor 1 beta [Fusarium heterosporum]
MDSTKPPRKRVSRACNLCRSRKVRCIIENPSDPCVNCRHNDKVCTFKRRHGIISLAPRILPSPSTPRSTEDSINQDCNVEQAGPSPTTSTYLQPAASLPPTISPPNTSSSPQYSSQLPKPSCHPDYAFLQVPDTKDLLPQDTAFLVSQGCFIVPQRAALDDFLRQYFLHVHPMLPILNEKDFWLSYNSVDSDVEYQMPMLVLQGLLFISSGFVSSETIKMLGFEDVHQAKLAFYRRAKLLYDFSCEKSCIAIAQASLLLAHTHLIPRCIAGNKPLGSIWLGIAISYARVAKAHCYSSLRPTNDMEVAKVQKLRNTLKRLWWCCIICDRLLPLTSRQSIKITPLNFSFSGCSVLGSADLSDELYNSDVYDSTTKTLHAELLSKLVDLCVVLTDVLTVTSVLYNNPSWMLSGRMEVAKDANICQIDLRRWYNAWNETKATLDERMAQEGSSAESIILFKNLIEMYYHSARLSVCHYNILRSSLLPPSQSDVQLRRHSEDLQGSASRVTECLLEFDRLGLSRWLPMTAIGCTAFPLALQMIDVELLRPKQKATASHDGMALTEKQRHVDNLLKQMKGYKNKYYITDWVMRAIRHVVELARQRSPTPSTPEDDLSAPSSCLDMLKNRPSNYLRLVMTLDMSISNGRLPDECDFPPSLRKTVQGLNARSQLSSMPMTDDLSKDRFSAMNKDLIPHNLTDMQSGTVSSNSQQMQMEDTRMVDQESFFNNKQPFPIDLTAALCEITNIPPLDFSNMPLLDSTHFNDLSGVPFWPYDLLGSPPDTTGQVEELSMNDFMLAGFMDDASEKSGFVENSKMAM